VHKRGISEQNLQENHQYRTTNCPGVGKETDLKRRPGERTGVEEIKQFHKDHHVDRHGTGFLHRCAPVDFILKQSKCTNKDDQPDNDHAGDLHPVQDGGTRVARRAVHNSRLLGLQRQCHTQYPGSHHVDPQNLNWQNGENCACNNGCQQYKPLPQVGWQRPGDELDKVIIHTPPFLHCRLNGGKIIVCQDHVRCFLGHVCSSDAHGNPDIGLLECGGIVHTITGHCHHLPARLQRFHQAEFLLGRNAGKHVHRLRLLHQFGIGKLQELGAGQDFVAFSCAQADLLSNGSSGQRVISCNHLHSDSGSLGGADCCNCLRARRIDHPLQTKQGQTLDLVK